MALQYFDIASGVSRDVTQDDLDELLAFKVAYGRVKEAISTAHTILVNELVAIEMRRQAVAQAAPNLPLVQPETDNA